MSGDRPTTLPPLEPRWLELHRQAMGMGLLRAWWAKAEILLGLTAVAAGIALLARPEGLPLAGGALFVLGGYLAMAGHRSHLYQSANKQFAYLLQVLHERERPSGR